MKKKCFGVICTRFSVIKYENYHKNSNSKVEVWGQNRFLGHLEDFQHKCFSVTSTHQFQNKIDLPNPILKDDIDDIHFEEFDNILERI